MNWPDFPPRRTNRGSTPSPEEVIGRKEFVTTLWRTLERDNVLLTAQRRLGKSSVGRRTWRRPSATWWNTIRAA